MKAIPNYHPPSDYRRPTKTQEKIYVPVNDYPEINFSILTPLLTFLLSHNHSTNELGDLLTTKSSPASLPALYEKYALTVLTHAHNLTGNHLANL